MSSWIGVSFDDTASDTMGCADGSNVCTMGSSMSPGNSERTVEILARTSLAASSESRERSNSMMTCETPSSETDVMSSTPWTGLNACSSRSETSRSIVSGLAPG